MDEIYLLILVANRFIYLIFMVREKPSIMTSNLPHIIQMVLEPLAKGVKVFSFVLFSS